MKRLMSYNISRMILTAAFLAFIAASAVTAGISVYIIHTLSASFDSVSPESFEAFRSRDAYNFGVVKMYSLEELRNPQFRLMVTNILGSSGMQVLLSLTVCKLITDEFRFGSIYKVISKGCGRVQVFLSYAAVSAIITAAVSLTYLISFSVFAKAGGISFEGFSIGEFIPVLLLQMFMLISFGVFAAAVSVLMEKALPAIMFCFVLIFALPGTFTILRLFFGVDIEYEGFFVFSRLYSMQPGTASAGDFICAVIWLALSIAGGAYLVKVLKVRR